MALTTQIERQATKSRSRVARAGANQSKSPSRGRRPPGCGDDIALYTARDSLTFELLAESCTFCLLSVVSVCLNLWVEAMQAELEAFQSSGFFVSPQPLLPPETMALIDQLQKEVEPEWMQTEFPPGCNRLACQFLMVMRRGGEQLLKIVEAPANLALAAALLGVDDNLDDDTGAAGAAERVVLEACGMGDTFDVLECNQIGW